MQAKPCPFCGCMSVTRRAKRNGVGFDAYIQCRDCGATGPKIYVTDMDDRKAVLQNKGVQKIVRNYWEKRHEESE